MGVGNSTYIGVSLCHYSESLSVSPTPESRTTLVLLIHKSK